MERFTIEDRFAVSVEAFERLLLDDAALYPRLAAAMPGIRAIEPLEREEDERAVRRRVRYTPNVEGKIPAFGRAFVTPAMLSWVEESSYDKVERTFKFRIVPNLPAGWRDRFDSRGSYALTRGDDGGVVRRIACELRVQVPLFGGRIERMLRREVEENFRAEANAIARWILETP